MFKYLLIIPLLTLSLQARIFQENFDDVTSGDLPSGWKAQMTGIDTNSAIWEIEQEDVGKILSLKSFTTGRRGPFNLCFTDKINFKNGEISVTFRANSGNIDQGGGLIWRVEDQNNYYVARFNPLEDNFRFYSVKNGYRKELKSADINLKEGWHEMKIIQKNNNFEGHIDGKKLLVCNNGNITKSGGVGVWSKADAATSFDNFKVLY